MLFVNPGVDYTAFVFRSPGKRGRPPRDSCSRSACLDHLSPCPHTDRSGDPSRTPAARCRSARGTSFWCYQPLSRRALTRRSEPVNDPERPARFAAQSAWRADEACGCKLKSKKDLSPSLASWPAARGGGTKDASLQNIKECSYICSRWLAVVSQRGRGSNPGEQGRWHRHL